MQACYVSPESLESARYDDSSFAMAPHNKSLLRAGGQWYLVCKQLAVIDKLPVINLGEPPGAELSRYTYL